MRPLFLEVTEICYHGLSQRKLSNTGIGTRSGVLPYPNKTKQKQPNYGALALESSSGQGGNYY